jgi:hypothetical protein
VSEYAKQFVKRFSGKIKILKNGTKDIANMTENNNSDNTNKINFCLVGTIE